MYIKDSLSYEPIMTQDLFSTTDLETLESCWIQLNMKYTIPILLGVLYKQPKSPVGQTIQILTEMLAKIQPTTRHELYILGDFNIDTSSTTSPNTQKLKWFCTKNGLDQLISKPTRCSINTSSTIDLIITNAKNKVPYFGTININISDHMAIFFNRKILKNKHSHKIIKGRSYRHYNRDIFIQDLLNTNWDCILETMDTTDKWCKFKEIFVEICNSHAPLKDLKVTQDKPKWLTNDIFELMNVRDNAFKKAKTSKDPRDLEIAKNTRNQLNRSILKAKRDYMTDIIFRYKNDHKKIWKKLKEHLPSSGNEQNITKMKNSAGEITESCTEIADILNEHFATIGPILASKIPKTNQENLFPNIRGDTLDQIQKTSKVEVEKMIKVFPPHKSMGIESFSTKLVKDAAPAISEILAHIINSCIETSDIPSEWKTARITPLYKDGKKDDPNNYRPISVLPFISKILEKVIYKDLLRHTNALNIFTRYQAGFRKEKSTSSKLISLTDSCLLNMDKGLPTVCVYIDLKKAFDTISHERLLTKLYLLNIRGQTLELFKNYLSNRNQMTTVNDIISDAKPMTVGVPQGSILGPVLFTLYINDIAQILNHSKICLFADDTVIYYAHKNIEVAAEAIQQDLHEIDRWMDSNKLTINIRKTQYMIISGHHKKFESIDIRIKDSPLIRTKSYKYLGVKIDQNLNYSQHINNLAGTVKNKIRSITRISHFLPKGIVMTLYKSLITPHFDYASTIWGSASTSLLNDLQEIQSKAFASLLKQKDIEEKDLHKIAKIQTLEQRRNEQLLLLIYNVFVLNHECYLIEKTKTVNHGHNTRNNKALHLPKPNTNYLKRTVTYRGVQLWNSIIPLLPEFDNKLALKRNYRKYCKNN